MVWEVTFQLHWLCLPTLKLPHRFIGVEDVFGLREDRELRRQVLVELGQEVTAGQTVCILEAMKMENHIAAHRDGTVAEVSITKGDVVDTGQPMVAIR